MTTLIDSLRQWSVLREAARVGIRRRDAGLIVLLQLVASAFEMLGLVSFVPVFQYLSANGDVALLMRDHAYWRTLATLAGSAGIPLSLASLLLLTFTLLVVRQALTLGRTLFEHWTRETATARLRARLFQRFLWASSDYQDRATSGGMVADITFNVTQAVLQIYTRLGLLTQGAICLVYLTGMVMMNVAMTGLLIGVVAVSALVAAPQIIKARSLGKDIVAANRGVAEFVVERLKLARLVRISRMEAPETATITRLSTYQGDANYSAWRMLAIVDTALELIAIAAGLFVVYFAVQHLGMRVELVGIFLAMLLRLLPVVRQLAKTKQAGDAWRASYEAVARRLDDLDAAQEPTHGRVRFAQPAKAIRLEDVDFAYKARPDAPVLKGVCVALSAERMTAIVGPSGSGKSTFIDLLPRLRTPDSGRITVDGIDLADFDLESLRKGIAYLSQSPLVFNVPLREHIAYGSPAATQAEIERAAKLAGIHDTITSLPDGYDTLAGEGGNKLSGGQRQRLDLARALLSRAPILILDEPAASLDGESARQLHWAIDRIRSETKTTIIIISHNLPSIRTADQIVVLRDGRAEAIGRHEELVRQDGWYATTWRAQAATMTHEAAPAA